MMINYFSNSVQDQSSPHIQIGEAWSCDPVFPDHLPWVHLSRTMEFDHIIPQSTVLVFPILHIIKSVMWSHKWRNYVYLYLFGVWHRLTLRHYFKRSVISCQSVSTRKNSIRCIHIKRFIIRKCLTWLGGCPDGLKSTGYQEGKTWTIHHEL